MPALEHWDDASSGSMPPDTYFAPPGRATREMVRLLTALTIRDPIVKAILESVGGYVLVLNTQRQILAASREVMDALNLKEFDPILGRRPGEAFGCDHAAEGPDGCGTAPACRYCGAVLAILAGQANGVPAGGECWLTMRRNGHLECVEFKVRAAPLVVGSTPVIALVLVDISASKRRELLERTFLHDARHIAEEIEDWCRKLAQKKPSAAARTILGLSERLTSEFTQYGVLLQAEQHVLTPRRERVVPAEVFEHIHTLFDGHSCAEGKGLVMRLPDEPCAIATDAALLTSVLVHMVKNALEATPAGGSADLVFEFVEGRPRFTARNAGVMPDETAARVFTRCFSTRPGRGRGLGTYAMRLVGERCLGGKVWFTSTAEEGTDFHFELPLPDADPPDAPRP